jgi:hypothetical protein
MCTTPLLFLVNNTAKNPLSEENNAEINQASDVPVINTFPVDIDLLFWNDSISKQNEYLDNIGNGTNEPWMMTPWGTYFMSGHAEGAPKWYLYARRHLEVFAPQSGTIEDISIGNDSVININENSFIKDVGVVIDIGNNYRIELGHLIINESIFNEYQSTNNYEFYEGQIIGYTPPNPWALDFYLSHKYENICPYSYLNNDLQSKLDKYYNLQYERAEEAGVWPESKICRNMSIEIENTLWGSWMYKTGPFDDLIENAEGWLPYQGQVLTFLNINYTNNETFHNNPLNPSEDLSDKVVGLARDNPNAENITDYKEMGKCLVELKQGKFSDGILLIRTLDHITEYGPENSTFYAKVKIKPQESGHEDDLLRIQYYSELLDAQNGFTNRSITYERFKYGDNSNNNDPKDIAFSPIYIIISLIFGIAISFFFIKDKQSKFR